METVGFCEIEDYPRRLLGKHFPGVPIHRDIRDLDGHQYEGTEVITAGFPCQPFSTAGKRRGKEDNRYLWPELVRVLREARPTWFLGENVSGIINLALDTVLSDLEAQDYEVETFLVPACSQNAPHRRERVWIIAHSEVERKSSKHDNGERDQSNKENRIPFKSRGSSSIKSLADSEIERIQGLWSSGIEESHSHAEQEVPLCRYERIGSSYWETEPNVGRVADGIPDRVDRLKGLGNAIVPQVAYQFLRAIQIVET
jgi:DNA (cytosine-5)-methyltransferase 1